MALRSVIAIDVDDDRFKAFLDLYNRYNDALKAMPGAWQKVNAATDQVQIGFGEMTAALMAQAEMLHRINREQDSFRRGTTSSGRAMHGIANEAKAIYTHIAETTRLLMRWTGITGIFGGLLGAGGLWGLDRMAQNASGLRTGAMGIGVSPSTLLSARVNFGHFFNAQSALENIANLQGTLGGQVPFNVLGTPGAHQASPGEALNQVVEAVHRLYQQTPANTRQMMPWWQQAMRIFGSADAIRVIGNMSNQELAGRRASFGRDQQGFGLKPGTLEAAQNVAIQLERVGYVLQYTFLAALTPIMPKLEALSGHLGTAVAAFLKGPGFDHLVTMAADGLQALDNWISGPDFKTDVQDFIHGIGELAKSIKNALQWMGVIPGAGPTAKAGPGAGGLPAAIGAGAGAALAGPAGAAVGAMGGAGFGLTAALRDRLGNVGGNLASDVLGIGQGLLTPFYAAGQALQNYLTPNPGSGVFRPSPGSVEVPIPAPTYAQGGIVPINAHSGEIVLPQGISTGLQWFFGSGNASTLGRGVDHMAATLDDIRRMMRETSSGVGPQAGSTGGASGPQAGLPAGGGVQAGPHLFTGAAAQRGSRASAGAAAGGDLSGFTATKGGDEAAIRATIAQAGAAVGLTPDQVRMAQAGFLSAFQFESGLNHWKMFGQRNPGDPVTPGHSDTGWAQWVGPRLRHMRGYGDPRSLEANEKQLYYELTGPFRSSLLRAGHAASPTESALAAHYFESGGAPQFEGGAKKGHLALAEHFYRKMVAEGPIIPPMPAPAASSSASRGMAGGSREAVRIGVTLNNQTGGSPVISSSQLTGP